jgi:hypothetical protein
MIFILKNWRLLAVAGLFIAISIGLWYIREGGKKAALQQVEINTIKVERKVQDEKARIRNSPPDRTALVNSLRNGTF